MSNRDNAIFMLGGAMIVTGVARMFSMDEALILSGVLLLSGLTMTRLIRRDRESKDPD